MKKEGNIKLNYPVKFAVMPIRSAGDFNGLKVLAYVPAKCYLVKKTEEYFMCGSSKVTYDVVFTWNYEEKRENITPSYMFDLVDNTNKYFNTTSVDEVYDDLMDARIQASIANEDLFMEELCECTDQDELEAMEEYMNNQINEYNEIANRHLEQEQCLQENQFT